MIVLKWRSEGTAVSKFTKNFVHFCYTYVTQVFNADEVSSAHLPTEHTNDLSRGNLIFFQTNQ